MILAGIDEAGYGPRLGPLLIAGNAFRATTSPPSGQWPECKFLGEAGILRVCDSKAAFSSAKGLGALEAAVLAFAEIRGHGLGSFAEFVSAFAAEGAAEALKRPWYSWRDIALPRELAKEELPALAAAARIGIEAAGLEYVWAKFCVVDEVRYNALLDRIGNKATLLFGRNAILMRGLWDEFFEEEIWLTADRHGGRKFYAGLLDVVFPEARIEILLETDDESGYRISGGGREMRIRFKVRADETDSVVALSSMWAKYVRELFMRQFNDYWLERAGGMKPTAGYWVDAERFLADLRAASVITAEEEESFTRWK